MLPLLERVAFSSATTRCSSAVTQPLPLSRITAPTALATILGSSQAVDLPADVVKPVMHI